MVSSLSSSNLIVVSMLFWVAHSPPKTSSAEDRARPKPYWPVLPDRSSLSLFVSNLEPIADYPIPSWVDPQDCSSEPIAVTRDHADHVEVIDPLHSFKIGNEPSLKKLLFGIRKLQDSRKLLNHFWIFTRPLIYPHNLDALPPRSRITSSVFRWVDFVHQQGLKFFPSKQKYLGSKLP